MKLAIVVTHPIQYYTPWFIHLSGYVDLHVYYMHQENAEDRSKGDFGVSHDWDIDLLAGYSYTFLKNIAKNPSVNNFYGCDTPEIFNILKSGNFDAVLVLGWYVKAFWQTIITCKRLHIPLLVRGDSRLQEGQAYFKKAIKRSVYPLMLKIFDMILYVGEENKRYLQYYGVNDKDMFFCPHFVDQTFFYKQSISYNGDHIRTDLNIKKDAIILLFVGKFIEKKRPLDILKAMKILSQEGIKTHGIFVGSGILEAELKAYHDKNTDLNVSFVGFKNQTELPVFYKTADILVLPSSASETWGLVVNEAFSVFTPAIVSDLVGCHPDLIVEGLTGKVYRCSDVKKLAQGIKDFIPALGTSNVNEAIKHKNLLYSLSVATENLMLAINQIKKKSDAKKY